MRKNLAMQVGGTEMLHDYLMMSRGNPGRGGKWRNSTADIQWMKRLTNKRIRRVQQAEMKAEAGLAEDIRLEAQPQIFNRARCVEVTVKRSNGRLDFFTYGVSAPLAFTSPSKRSLQLFEGGIKLTEFYARELQNRGLALATAA